MALTLAQAASQALDQIQRGVMEVISTSTTVLDRLGFETIEGNSYKYWMELALPTSEYRAVNAGYTESTGTLTSATESLVILGGDADVDRFLQLTRSNLLDQRATQEALKAKSVSANFSNTFINGSTGVDANAFNGLKVRLTGAQVDAVSMGTNGQPIGPTATDAQRHTFLDAIDNLISLVPDVDALYMNSTILARWRSLARRLTIGNTTQDSLGRLIDTYNNIPMLDIGNKADGTPIIPQTETQGASAIASSIYAVHFGDALGDQGVVGLTNGGVQVMDLGQLETKPVFRTRIEWFTGLALFGPRPAARLTGVLAA
jgi:hypothetical protein